ncbi:MAG: CIA30 family protein, partial [Candidatus Neomarinimicrobiota bacterium]
MLKIIPAAHILLLVCTTNILYAEIIYDFSNNTKLKGWNIVDDNVMGGRSRGSLRLDSNNNGVFSGYISLKNYGGFSSIRYRNKRVSIDDSEYIILRIYGDNNYYQLRIKSNYYDRHV